MNDIEHLQTVIRHTNKVLDNCHIIAEKLLKRNEEGDVELAKDLMCAALKHDSSKLANKIEWKYLRTGQEKSPEFMLALESHVSSNPHHPEYWSDMSQMPRVYIYEMVCDWKARSEEFGTDLKSWIKDSALAKYNISQQGKVWKEIKAALDLLLEKPFT